MWRTKFGADPQIVGRSITLSQKPYTVTGVLPSDGIFERAANDIYIPQTIRQDQMRRNTQFFRAWARLKPGVSVSQADGEMKRLAASLEQQWGPERKGFSTVVEPLRNSLVRPDVRMGLLILMGAVFFILLIASVTIVGVISDIKQSGLSGPVRNEIYVPLAQFENKNFGFFVRSLNFVIRTSGDPMTLAGTIQGIARSIDRDQPVYAIKTMDQVILGFPFSTAI